MIFDMGKNLKDEPFSVSVFTNPCREIALTEPEKCVQLTGKFPKKRGRPKMTEEFFYDPYDDGSFFIGVDPGFGIGNIVVGQTVNSIGHVTEIINGTEIKVNWKITYGK